MRAEGQTGAGGNVTRTTTLAPSHLEQAREDLAVLSRRLARGELDEASYQRQRRLILSHLTPEEQEELGPTPTPATMSGSFALGPSGGQGGGHRTSVPTPNGPAASPSGVDGAAVPTLADLNLKPGTILFDQWQIVREMGRGGFGAVFEAEELNLAETQAVKVLAPSMVAQDLLLARFRREVTLMRKLVHPHIGRVYDYREDLGQHLALISMEFIAGGTVRDLNAFAREWKKSIPLPLALAILTQMLEALAAAHAQGVIHRDVKPGNILLAGGTPEEFFLDPLRDPGVKLVDFGIAGQVECPEPSDRSLVLGTVAYVAPELVGSSAEVTEGADVYGAGAVAYELVTGELPLGRFDAPSQLREGLPEGLEEMLLALLSRRPAERPSASAVVAYSRELAERSREVWDRNQQVVELGRELEAALDEEDEDEVLRLFHAIEEVANGKPPPWMERARLWLAQRGHTLWENETEVSGKLATRQAIGLQGWQRQWIAALAACALVALVGVLWLFWPPGGSSDEAYSSPAAVESAPPSPGGAEPQAETEASPMRVAQLPPEEPRPRERTKPQPPPSSDPAREPSEPQESREAPPEPEEELAASPSEPEAQEPSAAPEELEPQAEIPASPPDPEPQAKTASPEASDSPGETASQGPRTDDEPEMQPASPLPEDEVESRVQPSFELPREDPMPRVLPAPELATLRIRSNVSANVVYLDGRRVGSTPLDKQVRPGSYRVEGRKAKCVSDSTMVSVTAGNVYDVFLTIHCQAEASEASATESPGRQAGSSSGKWMAFSGPGTLWREKESGLNMSLHFVPAGRFLMGSPSNERGRARDEIRHEVLLTRAFWMAETEVTQGQWKALMGRDNNPSGFADCGYQCPVEKVSWFDALAFANAMSVRSGFEPCYRLKCRGQPGVNLACTDVVFLGKDCKGYRLPTEAEWEYAARAGTVGPYSGGSLEEVAWHYGNSGFRTHWVGRKAANPWGLRDMLGNVWEWVWDRYAGGYPRVLATDPVEPFRPTDLARVFRGGSFGFTSGGADEIDYCRAASRYQGPPGDRANYVGFRLVRTHRE